MHRTTLHIARILFVLMILTSVCSAQSQIDPPLFKELTFPSAEGYLYGNHFGPGLTLSLADTVVSINNIPVYPPLVRKSGKAALAKSACAELCLELARKRKTQLAAGADKEDSKAQMFDALLKSALVDSVQRNRKSDGFEIWNIWFKGSKMPQHLLVSDNPPKEKTATEKLAHKRKLAGSIFDTLERHLDDGDIVLVASNGGPFFLHSDQKDVLTAIMSKSAEAVKPENWDYSSPIPREVAKQLLDPLPLEAQQ